MAGREFLSDILIKRAKIADRPYKLTDGGGLYLLVHPRGSKYWRFRYKASGRESTVALGTYPATSLKAARQRRIEMQGVLEAGGVPALVKKRRREAQSNTFEGVAREWLAKQPFSTKTLAKARWTFEDLLFPYIGNRPVSELSAPELLAVVRRLERRGKNETAHRSKQRVGQVIRYAIATGRAVRDPTQDLRGALAPVRVRNRPAITTPKEVGELLRAIEGYRGQVSVEIAFRLAPYVFVRPGELRSAEWREIDLEQAEWRIAASRMKMRREHLVPLSTQAVALFREIHLETGAQRYVFPSPRSSTRPLSDNAITSALRRIGYTGDQMTWHGFRAMASTLLNEQGFAPDIIELQLAHVEQNDVRAAYNRALRLQERRQMMQKWADYLDGLRDRGNVVPFRVKAW